LIVIGNRGPQIFLVLGDYLIAARRRGHRLGRSRHVLILTSSVECIEFSGNRSRASNAIVAALRGIAAQTFARYSPIHFEEAIG
jgi:hypothetical protein